MLADLALDGVRDRVLLLRTNPSFALLDDDDLIRIAEHGQIRRFKKGSLLMREGSPLERVFVLAEGHVTIRQGGRLVTEMRGQGGIGFIAVFAGARTGPEARAEADSTVLELPAEVVRVNAFESAPIARNALRLLASALLERRSNLPPDDGEAGVGEWRDRALTVVERVLLIRRTPLLGAAHLDAIAELARRSEEVRIPAGETVWKVGDTGSFSLRIDYGKVRCSNDKGESVVVAAGSVIGALDSLAGAPRVYHAVAETPVIAFRIEQATQLAVLEVHPQLAAALRTNLATLLLRG